MERLYKIMKDDEPIEELYQYAERFLHDVERTAGRYMHDAERMEQKFNKNGGLLVI